VLLLHPLVSDAVVVGVPTRGGASAWRPRWAESVLHGPGFTLRGGTNEILHGVVARHLGVR
jgi:acyl-CoA dehydrogenase